MATALGTIGFYFAQPWWLIAAVLVVPIVWLARRSLKQLGRGRRWLSTGLRVLVVLVLVAMLARPTLTRGHKELTLIVVLDRSQSIPYSHQTNALEYLAEALKGKAPTDRMAVVDVGEAAMITKLPAGDRRIPERNTSLRGEQTDLEAGVQMALAIAPPETGTRILLVSDGNQTAGDLSEAARTAAANKIPIDVLPVPYAHDHEVVFRRLVVPPTARSEQTVPIRFVLNSTAPAAGKLSLTLNGQAVDLDPSTPGVSADITLGKGTNVTTVSLPIGKGGMHRFEATFEPDQPGMDAIRQNNRASGMTYVAGPGHVLVVDADGESATSLVRSLKASGIDARYAPPGEFPTTLAELVGVDAVVLVNTDAVHFTFAQQEMLGRYVTELAGGLAMVGGPKSFGAGGWIGTPVAKVLPVDLDPPQKRQLPQWALVLVMHSCEMPQGNMWGRKVGIAAIDALRPPDLVGVIAYGMNGDQWEYKLSPVGDGKAPKNAINNMQQGDTPSFQGPVQMAYNALIKCSAGQKHIIVISDGDPSPPPPALIQAIKKAGITITGVAVFPHSQADVQTLWSMAKATGGRFYDVKDPKTLPKIFTTEAQVVRRSLIVEESFTPKVVRGLNEVMSGFGGAIPKLDGYVLTSAKGGVGNSLVLASDKDDPVLATGQSGLGRTLAFTSSADARWGGSWVAWGGFNRFWEQAVRWIAKSSQAPDCEVFADVSGRDVTVTVDAVDAAGKFVQFASLSGQVIAPDMSTRDLALTQVGPGRYRSRFQADQPGSYLLNMRYVKSGAKEGDNGSVGLVQTVVTAPYAPEYSDLSDNAPLLINVAGATGGRVLGGDPAKIDLFERAGVAFPETATPLTRALMIAWLALFLLDVAVRRIAVDFRAIGRWALATVRKLRPRRTAGAMLERLKLRRKQVQETMARPPLEGGQPPAGQAGGEASDAGSVARLRKTAAKRRYAGGATASVEMPASAGQAEKAAAVKPEREPPGAAKPEKKRDTPEHLARLLKAKREATGQKQEDKERGDS